MVWNGPAKMETAPKCDRPAKTGDAPKYGLKFGIYEEDGERHANLYMTFPGTDGVGVHSRFIGTLHYGEEPNVEFRYHGIPIEVLKLLVENYDE